MGGQTNADDNAVRQTTQVETSMNDNYNKFNITK
jgi:hypothetical protein